MITLRNIIDNKLENVEAVLSSLSAYDRTNKKELWGYKLLKRYNILEELFGNIDGWKRERGKKNQKAGVDIWVFKDGVNIAIDIKVCIGKKYSMSQEDYLPEKVNAKYIGSKAGAVEIYQYDFFTNTKHKLTDYMLYIIWDNDGLDFYLINYETIRDISLKNKHHYEEYLPGAEIVCRRVREKGAEYTEYTSFNKTGIYIKVPMSQYSERHVSVKNKGE